MFDQVTHMRKLNIPADVICSAKKARDNTNLKNRLRSLKESSNITFPLNAIKEDVPIPLLLYVTPEMIKTTSFREILYHLYNIHKIGFIF
jgi:superfamily II DNA helicase RecQ